MDKLDRLGWAGTVTLRVGEWHVGVRANSPNALAVVQAAFREHVVDDVEAPHNYSVILSEDSPDPGTFAGLQLLYRDSTQVVRTSDTERLLFGLAAYLSDHDRRDVNGGLLFNGAALVRDGHAVVVPVNITVWLDILAPRLYRRGIQFVDGSSYGIDVDTGDLVVPAPSVALERSAAPSSSARRREPPRVVPGRYPVVAWAFFSDDDATGPMSRPRALVQAAPHVHNLSSVGLDRMTQGLMTSFGVDRAKAIGSPFEGDLAGKLASLFG